MRAPPRLHRALAVRVHPPSSPESSPLPSLFPQDGYLAEWTYGTDWQFLCMGSK